MYEQVPKAPMSSSSRTTGKKKKEKMKKIKIIINENKQNKIEIGQETSM